MKKMVIIIGLLVLLVVVVGCTQGTLAGQAMKKTKGPCFKDYDIKVVEVQGRESVAEFMVNGESFTRTAGGASLSYTLSNGAVIGLDGTLHQDYAGGYHGVDFDLSGACSSDFAFNQAYYIRTPENEEVGDFTVVTINPLLSPVSLEESFRLHEGESKLLRDGKTKIILRDAMYQDYAGGGHGVIFELICS